MMAPLHIDFSGARRGSPWLGRALLAIAAVIAVDAGMSYKNIRLSIIESETRLARRTPAAAPVAKVTPQEVTAVRESVERLALPWNALFGALESVASDKVALTAIEPDTKKGTVTITGDGKDYLAALSYVSNLSQVDSLERVQLVRHEHKAGNPAGAVSFSVSAGWSTK
jgi:HAMP domain-containing protein